MGIGYTTHPMGIGTKYRGGNGVEEKIVLEQLKEQFYNAKGKTQLLDVFKKLVILEIRCLASDNGSVREIGYKAQTLQTRIENKL